MCGALSSARAGPGSGRLAPEQIDDEAGSAYQDLVAMSELLFSANANEDSRAGAEVGEHDRSCLFLDDAVLFRNQGVVRKD